MKRICIDGNHWKTNILNHLTFDIRSCADLSNDIDLPTNDEIRRTFDDFQNHQIISNVDRFKVSRRARCRIYSYPYQLKHYSVSNSFSGGLFECVREVSLYDERTFEHEYFFFQITFSFLLVKKMRIREIPNHRRRNHASNPTISIILSNIAISLIFHLL